MPCVPYCWGAEVPANLPTQTAVAGVVLAVLAVAGLYASYKIGSYGYVKAAAFMKTSASSTPADTETASFSDVLSLVDVNGVAILNSSVPEDSTPTVLHLTVVATPTLPAPEIVFVLSLDHPTPALNPALSTIDTWDSSTVITLVSGLVILGTFLLSFAVFARRMHAGTLSAIKDNKALLEMQKQNIDDVSTLVTSLTVSLGDLEQKTVTSEDFRDQFNALKSTVSDFGTRLKGIETDLASLNTTTSNCGIQLTGLETSLSSINTAISDSSVRLTSVETTLSGMDTTISDSDARLTTVESAVSAFSMAVSGFGTRLTGLETTLSRIGKTVSRAGIRLAMFGTFLSGFRTSLASVRRLCDLEDLRESLLAVQGQLETVSTDVKAIKASSDDEFTSLTTLLHGVEQTTTRISEGVSSLQQALHFKNDKTLSANFEDLHSNISGLHTTIEDVQSGSLVDLRSRLVSLRTALDAIGDGVQTIQGSSGTEFASMTSLLQALLTTLEAVQSATMTIDNGVSTLITDVSPFNGQTLSSQLQNLHDTVSGLSTTIVRTGVTHRDFVETKHQHMSATITTKISEVKGMVEEILSGQIRMQRPDPNNPLSNAPLLLDIFPELMRSQATSERSLDALSNNVRQLLSRPVPRAPMPFHSPSGAFSPPIVPFPGSHPGMYPIMSPQSPMGYISGPPPHAPTVPYHTSPPYGPSQDPSRAT